MLPAEEARASLLSIRDGKWIEESQRRARGLRRSLRNLADSLLIPPVQGFDPRATVERRKKLWATATALDHLSAEDLRKVMTALHQELGPSLAAWWMAAQAQPYGTGWQRRAFRAPSDPSLSRERRMNDLALFVFSLGPYAQPPEWFAAWAPHLNVADSAASRPAGVGPLLAAAIDLGDSSSTATFQTLIDCGSNNHIVGGMGNHVIVGLLRCSKKEAWVFVESMLLAAKGQEGLRQAILEAADEGHPEAFSRMIDLAVRENLIRFAATIRAVSVWFGFSEDAEHIDDAERRLELLHTFRSDRDLAARRVLEGDAWDTYAGLCALAQFDIAPTLELTQQALRLPDRDNRAAALRFLANTQLSNDSLFSMLAAMTNDSDLAVASLAHRSIAWMDNRDNKASIYDLSIALARRMPEKPKSVEAVGVDIEPVMLDRGAVVDVMVIVVGNRPLEPLLDFLPSMGASTRRLFVKKAGERRRLDGDLRTAVVKMLGDRSTSVREQAVKATKNLVPASTEVFELESLLTRKAGDLRRGVIALLSHLPVEDARQSALRLWAGNALQRDAASELLGLIKQTPEVAATAAEFMEAGTTHTQSERLNAVSLGHELVSDDPTLGLFELSELTPPRSPKKVQGSRSFVDSTSFRIVEALDDLAERHRDTPFDLINWQGSTEVLLADAQWLPNPFSYRQPGSDGGGQGMVLPEVFRSWWDERRTECRGESEPLDLLRAFAAIEICSEQTDKLSRLRPSDSHIRDIVRPLAATNRLHPRHPHVVKHVLHWLIADTADQSVIEECVEATEMAFASVPRRLIKQLTRHVDDWRGYNQDWRNSFDHLCPWLWLASGLFRRNPMLLASDHLPQWYGLMRWYDQPIAGARRHRVDPSLLFAAHAIGAASDADVYEGFTGGYGSPSWGRRGELQHFTKRKRSQIEQRHPTVVPLADRIRERVIEIERSRGEMSTPASHLNFRIASIEGAAITFELLGRLGSSTLMRGDLGDNLSRGSAYSRLIQISHPAEDDTPDVVSSLVDQYRIKERRLTELAMFAPQWSPMIELLLGWQGLEDAVWWFHTHTKDYRWSVEEEVRETWAAMSAERTPLDAVDLTDGAVDVEWFGIAHSRLGAKRWSVLQKSAKLASGGAGHRRAQIFADAMLGQLEEAAIKDRIFTKRHQDSVRALGLLPLPSKGAEDVALGRYQVLREFERGSKKFGQQRQRSEATAVRIGIENLARSTGIADSQRFIWAMEAAEAGDLADGPVIVSEGDLTVTLNVDDEGVPEISVQRGEKQLKSVPAKMRKNPSIKVLTDRKTSLKRQVSRIRRSLEESMVRQDGFVDRDFASLERHPVVSPMLELLVWVDADGSSFRRNNDSWVNVNGQSGKPSGAVRIAHPVDLLGTGDWISWQEQFFEDAQRQPFKQAFRELYLLTNAEAAASPLSQRWSGHQLQPRQANGLFTSRGWFSDREAGEVAKVFHHAGLVARVRFVNGWGTPAEVELPTIDVIYFTNRNEYLAQPLDSVPPVIFSETMRDLDLVVSVAHAGGVDPEASASTVEMRAALVRETARLMKLENVSQQSSHILIEGSLGEYSVHLGSGTVHRRPGGALFIIPVNSQRRGRIFLPFADDDPKSAEVVSKVLMLARDSKIKDPSILEQLRS